ncbi:hypothetical protein AWC17_07215 [Mycobacterium nebraskense]|uniref:Uncharacterized protein n=1 Tax=Mycobacterium nebraskense TaxID=244292 RepID=A0A0F5NDB0_9MYCO|nr:hypothetical protein WU83_10575 [Mycobacterium nebraskense]KLO33864.1 hypothetical protein ABW17_27970 [Mycobacterium nebraskense]ORW20784.1 hypothetical protein AWC17_07215 [Mycobacterium nebraskense]
MLTYGSHHQPLSQGTTVGWHTLFTGSHHEPASQSAKLTAGVAIAPIENDTSGAAMANAMTAMRRSILIGTSRSQAD